MIVSERLLVIADDFTGALDTGVQFSQYGANTRIITSADSHGLPFDSSAEVFVVNSDTRHLSAADAYAKVYGIVESGAAAGIRYFYKKTDSGLRGNIGSELAAALDASGAGCLHFFPSYPKMRRTTSDGTLFIDGIPVADSVFGKDLFEPVKNSHVDQIVREQTDVPVFLHAKGEVSASESGIHVYDSDSDSDLEKAGASLGVSRLHLSAGCAGFAPVLARMLGFCGTPASLPSLDKWLVIISGSLNPVTMTQIEKAVSAGIPRMSLSLEQKTDPVSFASSCNEMVSQCIEALGSSQCCIVDVGMAECTADDDFAKERKLSNGDISQSVSQSLGILMCGILERRIDCTFMCVGGDTLQAIVGTAGITEILPVCEITPGVPLSEIEYRGEKRYLLTKSGGFGDPDLLCRLIEIVNGGTTYEG